MGRSRCEGGLGQDKGEGEGERETEIHIPLVTDFIVQDLFGQGILDTYTQTIMRGKQWSPSRRQGPDCARGLVCLYVCVCASGDKANQWTTSLQEIRC